MLLNASLQKPLSFSYHLVVGLCRVNVTISLFSWWLNLVKLAGILMQQHRLSAMMTNEWRFHSCNVIEFYFTEAPIIDIWWNVWSVLFSLHKVTVFGVTELNQTSWHTNTSASIIPYVDSCAEISPVQCCWIQSYRSSYHSVILKR